VGRCSQEVACALGGIGLDAIPILTNALTHTNTLLRQSAISGLAEMGAKAEPILPQIIASLQDPSIQSYALHALPFIGTNQPHLVISTLMDHLPNWDKRMTGHAIFIIAEFGTNARSAVPMLTEFLGKQGFSSSAALALTKIIGTNQAIAPIIQALTNQDSRIQISLIHVLGNLQSKAHDSISALLPFARDQDEQLRAAAISSLIQISAEADVLLPILINELSSTNAYAYSSFEVFRTLANWGPKAKAAVPVLLERLEVLNKNGGQIPDELDPFEPRYGVNAFPFDPLDSEEFKALRKIDPETAAQIQKEINVEKAKASKDSTTL
jgi:hypothetical protein